jgi:gliding motility-associated-like protein
LCAGQTLTLNATVSGSGITYTWNTGDVSPTITVSALFKKYDVVVSNGVCSATDTILIDSINVPNKPTLGDDTIFCGDFSLLLFTGNNTIWSTGVVGTQIIVTAPGTYIAENKNQCGSAKDTINVTKFSLPNVNIGRDTSICDSIELSVGNGIFNSIFWSTNDTTKSIVVSESGIYTVKVTNTNCSKIDSITIVRDCDFDVYLPTAFSPNNDNVNDVLVPLSYEKGIVVLDFIIYDRWSEKIFEAKNFAPNDKNAGWKGLYKGEFAAVDNYAFYYLVKLPDGKIKSYKGTVALIR